MGNLVAAQESWVGKIFGNNWEIIEKYNCADYRVIYIEATGDETKKIKNAHYLVRNNDCGIETYMERTVIDRALRNNTPIMSKCKGCINCSKAENDTCYYAEMCRNKHLGKIPERTPKVNVGEIYGNFYVEAIQPSGNYSDHQCRATVRCIHCGAIQERRFDSLLNGTISCDCFRPHSAGEMMIKSYLEEHSIPYKAERKFDDLWSPEGGQMRYDFSILKDNQCICLIEFDGEQHYEEAGSYYNPAGTVQEHDNLKNIYAANNDIPLIRIPYWEILNIYKILDEELKKYEFY